MNESFRNSNNQNPAINIIDESKQEAKSKPSSFRLTDEVKSKLDEAKAHYKVSSYNDLMLLLLQNKSIPEARI